MTGELLTILMSVIGALVAAVATVGGYLFQRLVRALDGVVSAVAELQQEAAYMRGKIGE
ncbi:TPA_inf: hypothetical protein gp_02 [Marinomonas phage YY]|nr:TPA_inf: hypothetical protein gp_02 [Marinomonas phage YY]